MSEPSSADGIEPAVAFHFRVTLGDEQIGFAEVLGLEASVTKSAGVVRYGRVRLRRGIFRGDFALTSWFEAFAADRTQMRTVTIELLGEDGFAIRRWELLGAWPGRWLGPELRSSASEVALETLEIGYTQLRISDAERDCAPAPAS